MSKWVEGRVVAQKHWAGLLYSLKVEAEVAPFQAGQFTKLALPVDGTMVGRPYSFVNAPAARPHEFYYVVLPDHPLTPRLASEARDGPDQDCLWIDPEAPAQRAAIRVAWMNEMKSGDKLSSFT